MPLDPALNPRQSQASADIPSPASVIYFQGPRNYYRYIFQKTPVFHLKMTLWYSSKKERNLILLNKLFQKEIHMVNSFEFHVKEKQIFSCIILS
jgi:hypothetical protein